MRGVRRFLRRLQAAFSGIFAAFRSETHLKIHAAAACAVIAAGVWLRISRGDWVVLSLTIAAVIALELVNTAIERTVDLVTKEWHPLAKQAKDTAAGAVLVMAMASVIIGILIFTKYL